jgi:hypothetical protein
LSETGNNAGNENEEEDDEEQIFMNMIEDEIVDLPQE